MTSVPSVSRELHERRRRLTSECVVHSVTLESVLKLARHESISLPTIAENGEMDGEHGHVECEGDDDEEYSTSDEVTSEEGHGNSDVSQ